MRRRIAITLHASPVFLAACLFCGICAAPPSVIAQRPDGDGDEGEGYSSPADRQHRYLSRTFMRATESLNSFLSRSFRDAEGRESTLIHRYFGDRITAYEVEGSRLKISPIMVFEEGGEHDFDVKFSVRLRIKGISKRWKLFAESRDLDYDVMDDIYSARYQQKLDDDRLERGEAGLAYFFSDRVDRKISLSSGLRFRPEPSPRIRVDARFTSLFEVWRATYSQRVFWDADKGFGERSQLAFVRPVGKAHLLRFTSTAVWSELSEGVDWSQVAAWNTRFSPRRSASCRLSVRGHTHPSWVSDQYAVRLGYRQRVYRDWLFVEVEPGLDFLREDNFAAAPMITLKMEIDIGTVEIIP